MKQGLSVKVNLIFLTDTASVQTVADVRQYLATNYPEFSNWQDADGNLTLLVDTGTSHSLTPSSAPLTAV